MCLYKCVSKQIYFIKAVEVRIHQCVPLFNSWALILLETIASFSMLVVIGRYMLFYFSVDPTILYRLINILQNESFSDNLVQQSIETLKKEWLK